MGGVGRALQGGLGSITGTGQNSGILGLGQFHTDPYRVNGAAFAPDQAEQQYIAGLQQAVAGQGPSVAEQQMRRGVDQANAGAQSFAASQRGISPALAARLGAQQQAAMAQNANANAAMMRSQEQMDARGQLGQGLQSLRTGRMGLENLQSGNYNYAQGLNAQGYANAAGHRADFAGGIMNAAGGSGMMGAGGGMVPDPSYYNHTPNVPQLPGVTAAYNKDGGKQKQGPPTKSGGAPKKGQGAPAGAGGSYAGPSAKPYATANFANGGMVNASSKAGQFLAAPGAQKMAFGGFPFFQRAKFSHSGAVAGQEPPVPVSVMPYGIGVKGEMPKQSQPQMLEDKNAPAQMADNKNPVSPFQQAGAVFGQQRAFQGGGEVPGEAEEKGDSFKNDKVPAMLSPREIVLPRSVTLSEDAPKKAAEFVAAVQARQRAGQRKAS